MSKLTQSARDKDCTLNVVSVCNYNPETTVLCHLDSEFKGIALKSPDIIGIFGCCACHSWLDQHQGSKEDRLFYSLRALQRTLKIWMDEGVIKVA